MAEFSVRVEDVNEIQPLGNKLLVCALPQEELSKGGIIIPQTTEMPAMVGTVISVGPGSFNSQGELQPVPVKRGDVVAFNRYAGISVKGGEDKFILMQEEDLIATIDGSKRMDIQTKDALLASLEKRVKELDGVAAVG